MSSLKTRKSAVALATILGVISILAACSSPLKRSTEDELHQQLISAYRTEVEAVSTGPIIELQRTASDVVEELSPVRQQELNSISGITAYAEDDLLLGQNLLGDEQGKLVQLSLQDAIRLAVKNNLVIQTARYTPAISQTQLTQAEAVFDANFFINSGYTRTADPNFGNTFAGQSGASLNEQYNLQTGINKLMSTGGTITTSTQLNHTHSSFNNQSSDFFIGDININLTQPLLRGFGADVNRANIILARNALQSTRQQLRSDLINLSAQVEAQYWTLSFIKQQLLIQTRLLERTIDDRDRLRARANFDVNPVRLTEANSFVELRRSDVIRTRQAVRDASDELKRLINAPELPVSDETVVIPSDWPVDVPLQFSLLDAVTTALKNRPELQIALLAIKDASIQQRVASNGTLPVLNVTGGTTIQGTTANNPAAAWGNLFELEFVTYVAQANFEVPIGNRGPQAAFEQSKLQRRQSVVSYQDTAQLVVLQVKNALRELLTSYELIGATRAARLAAADNLRAIEEQEAAGVALTPEFLLDLKLRAQERLADAETQEVQSLTNYNNAISTLYQTMGTLLDRNGVVFEDYSLVPEN
ncbi:TolC family protein [Poriferisphaera sp. WC338]|uniref:TolC family protein n=1 Tax=Poriferisphaera sp. WC338 TaxID=3425129 RepID=UPI003D81521A